MREQSMGVTEVTDDPLILLWVFFFFFLFLLCDKEVGCVPLKQTPQCMTRVILKVVIGKNSKAIWIFQTFT